MLPRLATPCRAAAGCPSLAGGRGYCTKHDRKKEPFYESAGWRRARKMFLKSHPWCACGERANTVDHKLSISKGGADHPSNYEAMCSSCHGRKSVLIDGAFGHA